jgi:redox-sensing transcriptional repressor
MDKQKIAAAPSIRRLPSYLNIIHELAPEGNGYISGTQIAQELNLEPIQVRKDLAITGISGRPKLGYPADELARAIEHFLDWDTLQDAVLVGAGSLGTAILGYEEFKNHGLHIVAAFDCDRAKIGRRIHHIPVLSSHLMEKYIRNLEVKIAILTDPSDQAQKMSDTVCNAGISAIWNFTSRKLKTPPHVIVKKEDLSSGYAMLCAKRKTSY